MGYRVAVVGATGNVGREVLNILAERKFPADEVFALASSRSIGKELSYGDKVLKAKDLAHFDFSSVDFAIMSAGAYAFTMASQYNTRPRAAEVMVDGSRHHLVRPRETLESLFATETPLD